MEYLALYRKYRPGNLDDVVDQVEIKKILSNAIVNNTFSHAYLFSGPRGTGKTTMAKIFAKMVNCLSPVDGNACNKCDNCLKLLNSNDLIEIDAASNNGVDEIRDLREKANLVPSFAKYKVYIIDEVHMLTTQAFNALLKTLEEPPKHVIFILATTEYHKIPLTITSRCQKFQFSKISVDSIVSRLRYIANEEKINIDDDALFEIAKISDGGMRDSINFLDQLRSFNDKNISINDVYDICGIVSYDEIESLLDFVSKNDAAGIVNFFDKMDNKGKNLNKFLEDLILLFSDLVMYKQDVNCKLLKSNFKIIESLSGKYSISELYLYVDFLNDLLVKIKNHSNQKLLISSFFLSFMNRLNNNSNELTDKVRKDDVNEKYDLAFNFTIDNSESIKDEKVLDNIVDNRSSFYFLNRDIIINNAFALANKDKKKDLIVCLEKIHDFLGDQKYKFVAGCLVDTSLEVAGDCYLLFSCKSSSVVDKIYDNIDLCVEFINLIFEMSYYPAFVEKNEWLVYREQYIKNIGNGNKYDVKELTKTSDDVNISSNDKSVNDTVVDKLFELVGEENIEFK